LRIAIPLLASLLLAGAAFAQDPGPDAQPSPPGDPAPAADVQTAPEAQAPASVETPQQRCRTPRSSESRLRSRRQPRCPTPVREAGAEAADETTEAPAETPATQPQ
jgi:hypothetical protein